MNLTVFYKPTASDIYIEKSNTYERVLSYVPKPARICDLGCGSGKDTKYFADNGYDVLAIESSPEMCIQAAECTRQCVVCMDLDDLPNPILGMFDLVWAHNSLSYVEAINFPTVLSNLCDMINEDQYMYISFMYGGGFYLDRGDRVTCMNSLRFLNILNYVPRLNLIEYWISRELNNNKLQFMFNAILQNSSI